MVLRAISLAAVTSLVWSTRLKPSAAACSRTTCRIRTMSSGERIGIATGSLGITCAQACGGSRSAHAQPLVQQRHALLDVERGMHALERQAELDQRDRHRRP